MNKRTRGAKSERGIAMIVVLFSILVLSTLVATTIFVTQTEVWTSYNYRVTAQARYAAEAGIQKTMNWLSSSSYTLPTVFTGVYDVTKYPVQTTSNSQSVVLSGVSGISSNYPTAAVQTAYNTALSNQSVPGISNATFSTTATLLRMTAGSGVTWLGAAGGGGGVVQTWQITSVGSVGAVGNVLGNATVQLQAIYERTGTPVFNYAVAATSTACAAIKFGGTDFTDSFNSNNGTYAATAQASGGDIATNGNVTLGTSAKINGTIYDDNTTVGACPNGITVATASPAQFTSSVLKSSNFLSYPLPWGCASQPCYPSPLPPTTAQAVSTSCASIPGCTTNGTTSLYDNNSLTTANVFKLAPGSYGNLTIANADVVHLSAGTYDVNSLNFSKDGQIVIDSGPVVFAVAGQGYAAGSVVINSGGLSGWNLCANGGTGNVGTYSTSSCGGASKTPVSGIASNFQIVYAGPATISTTGAPCTSAIYAPNAYVNTVGGAVGLYGSIISSTFLEGSKAPVHYDSALQSSAVQVGQFYPVSFSWKKF